MPYCWGCPLFAFIYIRKRIIMSYTSTHTGEQIDDAVDAVISKESTWDGKADIANIYSAINALDKSDSAVAGKYVSSVSEHNGIITVTRADLPQGGSSHWGDITGNLEDQLDLKGALDAKATPADITTAINGLNKSGSPSSNQYISVVRQSAGIIETQKATLPMHTAGNGISVSSGTVSAKLGSGLSFDANGAIQATGGGGGGEYPAWVDSVPAAIQSILAGNPNRFTYLANSYTIPASGDPYWVRNDAYLNSLTAQGIVTTTGFDDYMSKHSFAESSDIPTKVSDLTNDSGFQTSVQVSTAITNAINNLDVNQVGGTGKYISAISESNGKISATEATMPTIPTKVSDLTNDSGFQTSAQVNSAVSSNNTTLGVSTSAYPVTGGSSKLKIVKVASLPATRDANTIYLVEE